MMNYFKLIRSDIDVASMYSEILNNEDAWYGEGMGENNDKREKRLPVQQHTQAILLRSCIPHPDTSVRQPDNQESDWTELSKRFPLACKFLSDFTQEIDGILSRALIVRLKPQGVVYRHINNGAYYLIRDRYHLVINSVAGSPLFSGDEQVTMQEGELWWFDNRQHHQAKNPSDDWRIHYIFDVLPRAYEHLAKNAKRRCDLPNWFIDLPNNESQIKNDGV